MPAVRPQGHGAPPYGALPPEDSFRPRGQGLDLLDRRGDVSVLERVWRIGEGTFRTWLTRAGLHAEKLHERFFRGLRFDQIQLDELWANVRQESQEAWVWVVMEATTKIVPVIQLGPRTLEGPAPIGRG